MNDIDERQRHDSGTAVLPLSQDAGDRGKKLGFRPGEVVGRYVIESKLGEGGMGFVHRARHMHTGRLVALKLLRSEVAGDGTMRARFLREAQISSRFVHPGAVSVLDFDFAGGHGYLVMELVEGPDLRELLDAGRLERRMLADIFAAILDVLDAAHAAGVVHRDIKPSNVKVLDGGAGLQGIKGQQRIAVKLLDFGLARLLSTASGAGRDPLTGIGDFIGTARYAAPEQIRGGEVGPPADIYSVGVMLFEALTGRCPFVSDTVPGLAVRHLKKKPPSLGAVRPELANEAALDAVVQRALAKGASDRHASAAAFATALEAALSGREAEPRAGTADLERALVLCECGGLRTKIFLVSGTRLGFGRSDKDPRRGISNDVVLRLLPARDPDRDPENWSATKRISNAHGEVVINAHEAVILDSSAGGIWLDGKRLPKAVATPLPETFALDIAGGVLSLKGRVLRAPGSAVQAVVLRRVSNAPDHVYVLLAGSVRVGPPPDAEIEIVGLTGGAAKFLADHRALKVERDSEVPRPLALGSWHHGGDTFTVLEPLLRHFCEVEDHAQP